MENMKFLQHVNSKRKEGQSKPDKSFFSIDKKSTRRYISESGILWETECGLLCDEDTFRWIEENCDNNILVVTEQNTERLKTFHFYKEIILSF